MALRTTLPFAWVVALACLHGPIADAEAAPWSSPQELVSTNTYASYPEVAVGLDGFAVVAWETGPPIFTLDNRQETAHNVQAAARPSSADSFGPPVTLGSDAREIEVGMGEEGSTILKWVDAGGQLLVSTTQRGEQVLAAPSVLAEGVGSSALAVASDGSAVIAFKRPGTPGLFAANREPEQAFTAPARITKDRAYDWDVAAAPGWSGLIWENQRSDHYFVARRSTGAAFGSPRLVRGASDGISPPAFALAPNGTALVLISSFARGDRGIVKASIADAGARFSRARPISRRIDDASFAEVDVDGASVATITWNTYTRNGRAAGNQWLAVRVGESFPPPRPLSGPKTGGELALDVNQAGAAAATWNGLAGESTIEAALSAGQQFGPPELISSLFTDTAIARADVSIGPSGEALAAWSLPTSTGEKGVFVSSHPPVQAPKARRGQGCPAGAPPDEQFDADKLRGLKYERAKRTAKRHDCILRVVKIGPSLLPATDDYIPNRINVALRLDGHVAKVTGIG